MTDIVVVDSRRLEHLIEKAEEELRKLGKAENIERLIEYLKKEVLVD